MFTWRYGEARHALNCPMDGAVQVSNAGPRATVADDPDGWSTGVAGAAAAGAQVVATASTPITAATSAAVVPRRFFMVSPLAVGSMVRAPRTPAQGRTTCEPRRTAPSTIAVRQAFRGAFMVLARRCVGWPGPSAHQQFDVWGPASRGSRDRARRGGSGRCDHHVPPPAARPDQL